MASGGMDAPERKLITSIKREPRKGGPPTY